MLISEPLQQFFNGKALRTILRQDRNFVWVNVPVDKLQKYTHLNTTNLTLDEAAKFLELTLFPPGRSSLHKMSTRKGGNCNFDFTLILP